MKKFKILTICLTICLLLVGCGSKKEETKKTEKKEEKPIVNQPINEEIEFVDVNSKSRPIAVMINNIDVVWDYQAGIEDAYLVYEIVVEGGYTRLMALFKDQTTERIGSIRSSRPYYLDYVMENDAIYVHFGGSDLALSEIPSLGINNINGMVYGNGFWRDNSLGLATEHTVFNSMAKINEGIAAYGYRTETDKGLLLNYVKNEDLSQKEGAQVANNVDIVFSNARSTSFKYDSETGLYKRFQNGYVHKDLVTNQQYTVKNIITYQVENYSYDGYRQKLNNIGSGKGYYITNGYAIPITWEKASRQDKTIYKYLDGSEVLLSDGNTHIEIQPINQPLTIN